MPSQFQPYYPRAVQTAAAAKQAAGGNAAAGGQSKSPISALIQAIGQQRQNAAAQQLMADPDPDWLYTDATPAAVAASPASYY
jgi:hypothetical protein